MKRIMLAVLSASLASTADAGGYRVSTQGQKAMGMGHTGVAMSDSSEVVFFNPGAMTQLEANTDIIGGISFIDTETEYEQEDTLSKAETDNPLGTPFNVYFAQKWNEEISYGFGIYTPYGNRVEWPTDWEGSHLVNEIELTTIYIQPTVGYQLSPSTSVGIGPTLVLGSVEFNRNLSTSLTDENGDRSNVEIQADNVTGWGYNVGLLHKLDDNKTSLGISYRSEVTLEARNEDADFDNIPAALEDTFADGDFDADLPLPAELTLGIAYSTAIN